MPVRDQILDLKQRLAAAVIGQDAVVDQLLIALLANGHLLMEGLPGLAKTRTIKTLAANLESEFRRIQFTPDLLPSDITGTEIYTGAGGKVTLVVELLAPGYFSGAASFDLPDPAGLLLLPPSEHPLVSGETIDGTYYVIQRHELAVYPATAGAHVIPPFRVRFAFKHTPLDHDEIAAAVMTPPLSLSVTAPLRPVPLQPLNPVSPAQPDNRP